MSSRIWIALLGAILASGCSSGGTVNGTIRGTTLSESDVVSTTYATSYNGVPLGAGVILITSSNGICNQLSTGRQPRQSRFILIALQDVSGTTGATVAPSAPGVYTISDGSDGSTRIASLGYSMTNTSCQPIDQASGISGSVTLSAVSGSIFTGSFDVILDSGERINGNFNPSSCSGLSSFIDINNPPICN